MNEKLMVDRACFERGCMGLPNPHERLIKEDEVVWLVEGREWVGLTDFEKLMLDTNYSTYFIEKTDKEKNVTYVGKQVDMLGLLTAVEKILKEKNT